MKLSEVFAGMRQLLDAPEKWTQGTNALARCTPSLCGTPLIHDGWHPVHTQHPNAERFCLQGAVMRVCGVDESIQGPTYYRLPTAVRLGQSALMTLNKLVNEDGYYGNCVQWNDATERSWEDVVLLLKRAQINAEISTPEGFPS